MNKPTVTKLEVEWSSHNNPTGEVPEVERFFIVAHMSDGREVYSKAVPVKLDGVSPSFMADIIATTFGADSTDARKAEEVLQSYGIPKPA